MTQDWTTPTGRYRLQIQAKVWKAMFLIVKAARGVETGGLLLGKHSADARSAVVTEILGPPVDSTSERFTFHRGRRGLKDLLMAKWDAEPRTYYLGEWHSHPAYDLKPSPIDVEQMRRIASYEPYRCRQPLLIICGPARELRLKARLFIFPDDDEFSEFSRI